MTDPLSVLEFAAQGARWVLVVAFVLSAAEKAKTLGTRASSWHPTMLRSPWRRSHATRLMSIALVGDACAVFMLIVLPAAGALLSAGLLAVYTVVSVSSRRLSGRQACQCFARFLNTTTRRGDLSRNLSLLLLSAAAALATPTVSMLGVAFAGALLAALHFAVKYIDGRTVEDGATAVAPEARTHANPRIWELG